MRQLLRFSRITALSALVGVALLAAGSRAKASFLDDNATFGSAISALRSTIGDHPRVLRIEVDADSVAIEAQDPRNRNHIDRWRYVIINILQVLPLKRLTGPEPVDLQLLDPDLEANLFDVDAVDFSAMPKLVEAALARARLQDAAAVTHMDIARQTFILPSPTSGDIRWTLRIDSGRERAEIHANAQGVIVRADLSNTQRARTLNLLNETTLAADAAAAFRGSVGAGPVLTKVGIEPKIVSFATNIRDETMPKLGFGMPATARFTWDLNGLQRRLGAIDVSAQMRTQTGTPAAAPFSVDDVNWTILAKLEQDALARVAIPKARVTRLGIGRSSEQPGRPVLAWSVEVTDPTGEVTSVIADVTGAIQRVVLPVSRRPKANWLDAATIAGAIARIAPTFGADAKISSIVFEDRGARITVDDPANGGRAATFDFSADGVTRAAISFSLDSTGPRFSSADVAPLNEQAIAALEAEAMKRLASHKPAYLESISIGAHPFVRRAGAHAIEVRLRDIAEDSVRAHYAWIVFDFNGSVLDFVTF
jgi:hypothetical protein